MNQGITAKMLQDEAYPLTLVYNHMSDALGLRHQAEVFYLNFPKLIRLKNGHKFDYETKITEENLHLIETDLHEIVKIIRSERKRALKHYVSIVIKFFFKETK